LGSYTYSIWSPQIIKSYVDVSNLVVGVISGSISAVVILTMMLNNRHSDRTGERPLHVAIPLSVTCCGFVAAALMGRSPIAVVFLAFVPLGIGAAYGPFWSMPSAFLVGEAAAGGIAMAVTIGNFAGFIGPVVVGYTKAQTGSYTSGLLLIGGATGLAGLLAFFLRRNEALASRHLPAIAK